MPDADNSLEYEMHVLPNGERVFYIDKTHSYFVNGVELPSITTILASVYGDIYSSVNKTLLAKSAEYGTSVHSELRCHIDKRIESPEYTPVGFEHNEVRNYFEIVEPIWQIRPIMTERVVVLYSQDGAPVAAGRFDLLCDVGDQLTLADFKTTSVIHRKQVTAQLNLYLMAAIQSDYLPPERSVALGVIHLHGPTSKFVPIQRLSSDFYLKFLD